MSSISHRLVALLLLAATVSAYTWPNPRLDELESWLYDQHGYNSRGLIAGALGPDCSNFGFGSTPNRSNAADWVRAAYHDMAPHNKEDGSGGLDASIQFEQDRAENAGTTLFNTLRHLSLGISRYVSVADMIALGAATAVEQCNGPKVPFRGGRIDATEANNPGVPEPQQDIDSHIANFARQGFNQTEMIALVACGHALGGVQASAFPTIVPLPEGDDDFSATFDSTPFNFDNNVATEYIHDTTQNPLVVGHNDTTNSDKRIFSSDGNATMSAFAQSADFFKSTCGTLLARMLDTVPKGVELTEVIEPLTVKPQSMLLRYMGDDTLKLSGEVRFWNMTESASRTISILWADRTGATHPAYHDVLGHTSAMVSPALNDGPVSVAWYGVGPLERNFTLVDAAAGISRAWFVIDDGTGGAPRTEDQDGAGFALRDALMPANTSCVTFGSDGSVATVDIAVRADTNPSRVYLEYDIFTSGPNGGTTITIKTTDAHPVAGSKRADSGYTMWTAALPQSALLGSSTSQINLAADMDGGETVRTSSFSPFSAETCA